MTWFLNGRGDRIRTWDLVLLIVLYLSEHIGKILKNKNLFSGILIGIGAAFSWVALIDI